MPALWHRRQADRGSKSPRTLDRLFRTFPSADWVFRSKGVKRLRRSAANRLAEGGGHSQSAAAIGDGEYVRLPAPVARA
jgi:hypothetical protein